MRFTLPESDPARQAAQGLSGPDRKDPGEKDRFKLMIREQFPFDRMIPSGRGTR
jgi:hypothetical protein